MGDRGDRGPVSRCISTGPGRISLGVGSSRCLSRAEVSHAHEGASGWGKMYD